ncbi:MAG: DsbA family protein [Rhodospirillaceae bacterium]|jgi:protein-disulfide isomerase|nr:DsbA family protein [Rhodospirillaceae bacterium]MBT7291741.1 DsbA family protein [Rhodospirillaceae bacterium]
MPVSTRSSMRHATARLALTVSVTLLLLAALITQIASAESLPPRPGDRALGSGEAPITMVEYYSLDCPHCANFHRDVFPKLKAQFIETGKVRYVFRDYPLSYAAVQAAILTHCAPPERFFAVIDALLKDVGAWSRAQSTVHAIAGVGAGVGVSAAQYQACLDGRVWERQVFESQKYARDVLGVKATPTFFINDQRLEGNLPFEALARGLNNMLEEIKRGDGNMTHTDQNSLVFGLALRRRARASASLATSY